MTLATLDVKLHLFFFSWPALTFCIETTVFLRWQGGKIFSFKLAGNSYSGGYPLPPAHINHTKCSTGIQMEEGGNLLGSHSKMQTKWLPQRVRLVYLSD